MARAPANYRPSRSAQDDIQHLLDECDRMQRNWDLPDGKSGRTGRRKSSNKADFVGDKASNGSGNRDSRDMLSWALARHQALEDVKTDTCISTESAETNAMADALREAKDALADAKLRIRVAEASERARIKEKLEKEMGQVSRRTSAPNASDVQKAAPMPTPRVHEGQGAIVAIESEEVTEPPVPPTSKIPESEALGENIAKQESGELEERAVPLVPRPPSQDPMLHVRPPRWKVVGGVGKGGIIVREKRDLQSLQLDERLSTGALVEQTELIGDRLHFAKVSGSGPETGWVSIRMASKDLLVVVKPPRHWRSERCRERRELVPVLRSSSAQCSERPRVVSLPQLPQPKSAPPGPWTEDRRDHSLPPLPHLTQDRSMYSMQPAR